MTTETNISDRLTYATFPAELKAAMRAVAQGYGWERDDWRFHTQCCQAAMLKGVGADDLADRYLNPHPACLQYRLKPPQGGVEATH